MVLALGAGAFFYQNSSGGNGTFIGDTDTPPSYNDHEGEVLVVATGEDRLIFAPHAAIRPTATPQPTPTPQPTFPTFLSLHDTIASYTGCANKPLEVTSASTVHCGEYPSVNVSGNLPTGGLTNEVLIKTNNTDYATNWGVITWRNIDDNTITSEKIGLGEVGADNIDFSTVAIGLGVKRALGNLSDNDAFGIDNVHNLSLTLRQMHGHEEEHESAVEDLLYTGRVINPSNFTRTYAADTWLAIPDATWTAGGWYEIDQQGRDEFFVSADTVLSIPVSTAGAAINRTGVSINTHWHLLQSDGIVNDPSVYLHLGRTAMNGILIGFSNAGSNTITITRYVAKVQMRGHDGQLTGGTGYTGILNAADNDSDWFPSDYELFVPSSWDSRVGISDVFVTVTCTISGSPSGNISVVLTQRDASGNGLPGVTPDSLLYSLATGGKQEIELTSLDPRMRRLQFDAARGGTYASGESATCDIEGAYLVVDLDEVQGKLRGIDPLPPETTPTYNLGDGWIVPGDGIYELTASAGVSGHLSTTWTPAFNQQNAEHADDDVWGFSTVTANSRTIYGARPPGWPAEVHRLEVNTSNEVWLRADTGTLPQTNNALSCTSSLDSSRPINFNYDETDAGRSEDIYFAEPGFAVWRDMAVTLTCEVPPPATQKPFTLVGDTWVRLFNFKLPKAIVPNDLSTKPTFSEWLTAMGGQIGSGLTLVNGVLAAIVALPVNSLPANPTQGERIILEMTDSIADNRTSTAVQDQTTLRRLPLDNEAGDNITRAIETFSATYLGFDAPAFQNRGTLRGHPGGGRTYKTLHITPAGGTTATYAISSTSIPGSTLYYYITGWVFDTLTVGRQYTLNIEFTDGTFLYPPTVYEPNVYVWNSQDGWVTSPGVAAAWATPGSTDKVPVSQVRSNRLCYDNVGTGHSQSTPGVSSAQLVSPALTGGCPGLWRTDSYYTMVIDWTLVDSLGTGNNANLGFNQFRDRVRRETYHFTGNEAAIAPEYAPITPESEGVLVDDLVLYRGTTAIGRYKVYIVRQGTTRYMSVRFQPGSSTTNEGWTLSSHLKLIEIDLTDDTP